jgi:membrane fusion protein (multidrug efflux system)
VQGQIMGEPEVVVVRRFRPELIWRGLIFVFALAILFIVTTRWTIWEGAPGWQITDDAYLQADVTPVAAKVAGYVLAVPVQDYERVHKGQLVARIVDSDYAAIVSLAQAHVAAAKAHVEALGAQRALQQANLQAAHAAVAIVTANGVQNARDLDRQQRLLQSGSSTIENSEKLRTTHLQLQAQIAQSRAQADAAARQLDVLAAQQKEAAADVAAQQANLQTAQINLGYTDIVAPQDGVLGQRQVLPGQFVGIGGQITTLTPLPQVWVVANYKETQLPHMAVGQKAQISIDTYPGRTLSGHVAAFSPATGAQFSLLPPDNATGNFTKVVQRVAVKIVIDDPAGLADLLKPGMSVVARVDASASLAR